MAGLKYFLRMAMVSSNEGPVYVLGLYVFTLKKRLVAWTAVRDTLLIVLRLLQRQFWSTILAHKEKNKAK